LELTCIIVAIGCQRRGRSLGQWLFELLLPLIRAIITQHQAAAKEKQTMQSQTLQIGAQTIAFHQSAGTGPPVLLVHGNSSSGLSFQHQLESPLGQEFRLVAIDLPGHGQSEPATDPQAAYTLPGYASIVVGVAERLGLKQAVFVGWSLGGHIVLEASGQLSQAAGFMIYGTPPIGFPPAMAEAFLPHPAMNYTFKAELSAEEIQAFVAAFFAPEVTDIPEQFMADVRRTDGRARQVMGGSIGPGGYKDEIEVVAQLSTPLAIVHGEREQLVNGAYVSALTLPTLWRGALQIIPKAGHAPHWEQPEQFNGLLEAFIKETAR
jgi:pimeloyl-ACP methyl ester carboxylesterase